MNECASKLCSTMVYWKNTAYENQVKAVLLGRALLGAAKYRFLQLMQTENAKLARSNRMVMASFTILPAICCGTKRHWHEWNRSISCDQISTSSRARTATWKAKLGSMCRLSRLSKVLLVWKRKMSRKSSTNSRVSSNLERQRSIGKLFPLFFLVFFPSLSRNREDIPEQSPYPLIPLQTWGRANAVPGANEQNTGRIARINQQRARGQS